MISG
jgi:hypothetical protein